jgi:hypothetical protein
MKDVLIITDFKFCQTTYSQTNKLKVELFFKIFKHMRTMANPNITAKNKLLRTSTHSFRSKKKRKRIKKKELENTPPTIPTIGRVTGPLTRVLNITIFSNLTRNISSTVKEEKLTKSSSRWPPSYRQESRINAAVTTKKYKRSGALFLKFYSICEAKTSIKQKGNP